MVGRIDIIIGPMYSGKSTFLINEGLRKRSVLEDKEKVLLINSALDSRCDEEIKTHAKHRIPAYKANKLEDLYNNDEYIYSTMVLIDEGQFFPDLYNFVTKSCYEYNKHIIIASLDGDYKQQPFGQVLSLIPHADNVKKMTAYCMECADAKTPAPFTKRIIKNCNDVILVGAGESYISVCRKHLTSN
jgi:thymidine kinase